MEEGEVVMLRDVEETFTSSSVLDELRSPIDPGDLRGAFEAAMASYGPAVYALCMRVLRDATLAQDVLQQVFLEAYRDLGRFEGRSSLRSWLLGIASHRCYDALKAARRRGRWYEANEQAMTQAMTEYRDPMGDPFERLGHAQLAAALEACLEELSSEVVMTVLLRFHAGMSYEEMSSVMAVKADTLHARVARALPVLRRCLERKGWGGE
jgi:RNA polymerase sigma-70 factor, ECF subfamily